MPTIIKDLKLHAFIRLGDFQISSVKCLIFYEEKSPLDVATVFIESYISVALK